MLTVLIVCAGAGSIGQAADSGQVPTWSAADLEFFLHGSMSTEVVPETVLRAFIRTYPDLFPTADLSHLGLIPDPQFGWPIGFSRKKVANLGGLSALGVNCASCHVGEIVREDGAQPVRVLGMTALFDAEAYFGSIVVATFRTADPQNMQRFLAAYLTESDAQAGAAGQAKLAAEWARQAEGVAAAIAADPTGAEQGAPGALVPLREAEVRLDLARLNERSDLPGLAHAMLKLFHNMRATLHVPDRPPEKLPPASGPGRNDAFGLLSAALLGAPQPYAPVKYGLVWSVEGRPWVHWDGNTRSPIGRNLLASLGLGAPLVGHRGQIDFAALTRQTTLSERIRPPRYPFTVDAALAERGAKHYTARCAGCHSGAEGDSRLHAPGEIHTEPQRALTFTPLQAERLNGFLSQLEVEGYKPGVEPGIRSTQKYWAASLAGVWARSPYLHNGSVRTMHDLLTPSPDRPRSFHRGTRAYDLAAMGYADGGPYVLDTTAPGNASAGHEYGTDLSADEKRELIEYLKTL
jgi:mono/diheme cytochrome c family protein